MRFPTFTPNYLSPPLPPPLSPPPPCAHPPQAGTGLKYLVKCTFLEIYNEKIFDLLDSSGGSKAGLSLRESLDRGVYVDNLTEEVVASVEQAEGIMRTGARNRRVGATAMNRESSRSHRSGPGPVHALAVGVVMPLCSPWPPPPHDNVIPCGCLCVCTHC
jgi:hypothetical protein